MGRVIGFHGSCQLSAFSVMCDRLLIGLGSWVILFNQLHMAPIALHWEYHRVQSGTFTRAAFILQRMIEPFVMYRVHFPHIFTVTASQSFTGPYSDDFGIEGACKGIGTFMGIGSLT